jgi:hypothetical protein
MRLSEAGEKSLADIFSLLTEIFCGFAPTAADRLITRMLSAAARPSTTRFIH